MAFTLDALVPLLQPKTEDMRRVVDVLLNGDGFAVLPGVLSADECRKEYDRAWGFVMKVSPAVKRDDPSTWYPTHAGNDPWPHTGDDCLQSHQAGWVFNDLRETLARRVFEPL